VGARGNDSYRDGKLVDRVSQRMVLNGNTGAAKRQYFPGSA
jgi:hypothetical protein